MASEVTNFSRYLALVIFIVSGANIEQSKVLNHIKNSVLQDGRMLAIFSP